MSRLLTSFLYPARASFFNRIQNASPTSTRITIAAVRCLNTSRTNPIPRTHYDHKEDGSIPPIPTHIQLGAVKAAAVIAFGIYTGAMISKYTAAYLEENDIFVPKEDDD